MKVLLVTTWEAVCGISEHASLLKDAVEQADPEMQILPEPTALDPHAVSHHDYHAFDVLHLNYHAALHSRWTPEVIREAKASGAYKGILVTYHDSGVPNSDQCKAICAAADYFVVHEPYDDLPAHGEYLRMGVSDWQLPPAFDLRVGTVSTVHEYGPFGPRPVLGSAGFPFPWKGYNELAQITGELGWGLYLIAPTATEEQVARWKAANPWTVVRAEFLPRQEVVSLLAACDATAFPYSCANTGQSGAILQGVAARKPLFAFGHCRQFRALKEADTNRAVWWADGWERLRDFLDNVSPGLRCDPAMVGLAHQERWSLKGEAYARIYRSLL